jgi:hypothetical protein
MGPGIGASKGFRNGNGTASAVGKVEMKKLRYWLPMAFATSFAVGFASCDKAEQALDCNSICSRYQDCWDQNYNVGNCRNGCRDKAGADAAFERKVDMCASCIEDRSCSGTFVCAVECAGVVP